MAGAVLALLARPRLRPWGRESESDAQKALNQLGTTVCCLLDSTGLVRSITANARIVLGDACERAAELGLSLTELIQPDDPVALSDWMARTRTNTTVMPCRIPARSPDGGTRWIELSTPGRVALGDGDTLVVELRATAPVQTQRALQLQLLAAAMDSAVDAVFITDVRGHIQYVNPSFEKLTGWRVTDIVGRTPAVLSSGRHRPDFFHRMWTTLSRGDVYGGEVTNRRPDGALYTIDLTITRMTCDDAQRMYVAVARDITERKRVEREVEDQAYYDSLTGLANHRLLKERSRQMLALARRHGSISALLHIDMVRLQSVNVQHGRASGDEVLRTVAERLRQGLRESDTLARTGSDEFLILLGEVADTDSVARVVARLHESIARPFRFHDLTINLSARIGVALYPQDAGTYDELLECSEAALRRAEHSNSPYEFYERDVSIASRDRLALEEDLHWAWEHDQFVLHYQPIIAADGTIVGAEALTRGHVVGMEALARLPHLERGFIGPQQFIALAERTGRILSLDRWAIATAAKQAALWTQIGFPGWVSVNLSARTLHDPDLPDYISRTLATHGLGAGKLVVEITESTAMRDPAHTATMLETLRGLGVMIAVDDFGVGHSSLAYLRLFPVDLLKLDASFINGIGCGGREEQLLEIMISLAHRIGAKVVAEGVEEEHQMTWLRQAGCDFVQGYYIGRPAPPEQITRQHGPRPTIVG